VKIRRLFAFLAAALAASCAYGAELVGNGDFELPTDSAWQLTVWGNYPDTGNCRLRRFHDIAPDRDFEVALHKMLHQGMKLWQRIPVSTLDLGFSVSCRLTAKTEQESLYAAASIYLEYLDAADSVLGETRIYSATPGCDWEDSPTLHLIRAPDSLNWHDYRFNVSAELDNLAGVNRDSIAAVRLGLYGFVLDNC
jgi:hypothetical protein